MHKIITLHNQVFPTIGNEVCVEVYLILREKKHTLVLSHTNVDGESDDLIRKNFTTSAGLIKALEQAENEEFALDYDLQKMISKTRRLPKQVRQALTHMQASRAMLGKSEKHGNCIINYISPKEAREKHVGSMAFVGRPFISQKPSADKAE